MNLKKIKKIKKQIFDAEVSMDVSSTLITNGHLSLDEQIMHLDNFAANQTMHMLKSEELYKLLKNG